jgi:hypothetical protein
MVDISRSQSYENPNDFNCKDVRRHNIEGEQSILWPGPRSKIRCEDEKTGLTAVLRYLIVFCDSTQKTIKNAAKQGISLFW